MSLITILKLRKKIIKNFIHSFSIIKVIITFIFCVSAFVLFSFFNSKIIIVSSNDKSLINSIDLNSIITFGLAVNFYFYFKTVIRRNKFKIRGAYGFLASYLPRHLNKLYFYNLIDRGICTIIITTFIIFLVYGLNITSLSLFIEINLLFAFISFSDYYSKLLYFSREKKPKVNSIIALNLCSIVFVLIPYISRKLLGLGFIIIVTTMFCRISEYDYRLNYREKGKSIGKHKKSVYTKLYYCTSKIIRNKKLSFVASKEFLQIYMERIPLFYSIMYGSIIALLLPIMIINGNMGKEIYIFSYLISVSYSLVGISLNIFARDLRGGWIYKLYKLSKVEILAGKYIAYYIYSLLICLMYYFIYMYIAKIVDYSLPKNNLVSFLIVAMFIVSPIAFLVGGNIGSYFIPKIKYKRKSIDYAYNGVEVLVLFITIYLVSLPAYMYGNMFRGNIYFLVSLIVYFIFLIIIILARIDKNLLVKGGNHERK